MEEIKVILTFLDEDGEAYDGTEFFTTHDRLMDMHRHPENYGYSRFTYTAKYKSREQHKKYMCCAYD